MKGSVKLKKIIWIAILGIFLLVSYGLLLFFLYMGLKFGYQDLNQSDYLQTQAFADLVRDQVYDLDCDAEIVSSYTGPNAWLMLDEMVYDDTTQCLTLSQVTYTSYTDFMEDEEDGLSYTVFLDETGAVDVVIDEYEYNPDSDWYNTSPTQNQIAETNYYAVVSKQDYIDLILAYTEPNSMYTSDVSYYWESDGDVAEATIAYSDDRFDSDTYVGSIDGVTIAYSPTEDIFYSDLYGWYMVPEQLYFLAGSSADNPVDTSSPVGIELVLFPFIDKNTLLNEKVGYNYTEYLLASVNLHYSDRNFLYFTCSDSVSYTNTDTINQIINCECYMKIHQTDSGEFTIELNGFENSYMTDTYASSLMNNLACLVPDSYMYIGIYTSYPYADQFDYEQDIFNRYYKYTIPALVLGVLFLSAAVLIFISLTRGAGRVSKEQPEIHLSFLDKWPVEIMFLAIIIGCGCIVNQAINFYEFMTMEFYWRGMILSGTASMFLCYCLCMTAYLSLVRRAKAKQMWNCLLLRGVYRGIQSLIVRIIKQKNLVARTVEILIAYWIVGGIGVVCCLYGVELEEIFYCALGMILILVVNITALIMLIRQAKGEQMIRETTATLMDGNIHIEMPAGKPLTTERQILENIEHLSDGLQKAVEQSIYDERMKAELITNVSHDIKTPLTSIINYVDLMKREDVDNDKMIHYIEVLDQKSHRLKQLTDDLVEISKISSGNLELECMPIDFGELVRQSIGEFEDKFAEHELQILDSISEEAYMIYADGRRTFRVMDNLMQNVYKYAMPKTRVYIDLTKEEDKILLSIKNISQAELNISSKELMERFVRGDQSRSTEGSGLGLSIAGDLVRLQNGSFDIQLDGDLFKVIITFTEYNPPQEKI